MSKRMPKVTLVLLVALVCVMAAGSALWALDLGDILKVGGVAFLVSQYGGKIDSFITSALGERNAAAVGATKVVPILSLGGGGYIGAAQVVGNPDSVKKVKAVFQLEGRIGSFRPKILVPTYVDKVQGTPERAKGVGVSAVIEFRI
jgi:hypothetical protein